MSLFGKSYSKGPVDILIYKHELFGLHVHGGNAIGTTKLRQSSTSTSVSKMSDWNNASRE